MITERVNRFWYWILTHIFFVEFVVWCLILAFAGISQIFLDLHPAKALLIISTPVVIRFVFPWVMQKLLANHIRKNDKADPQPALDFMRPIFRVAALFLSVVGFLWAVYSRLPDATQMVVAAIVGPILFVLWLVLRKAAKDFPTEMGAER